MRSPGARHFCAFDITGYDKGPKTTRAVARHFVAPLDRLYRISVGLKWNLIKFSDLLTVSLRNIPDVVCTTSQWRVSRGIVPIHRLSRNELQVTDRNKLYFVVTFLTLQLLFFSFVAELRPSEFFWRVHKHARCQRNREADEHAHRIGTAHGWKVHC